MILVSGASGFLGSAIAGLDPTNSIGLLRKNDPKREFRQFEVDLSDDESVEHFIESANDLDIETFVHCAAITPWGEDPDFSKDITMAANVAKICEAKSVSQLIFISGWVVYDDNAPSPYKEDDTPLNPATPYGKSKKEVEDYFLNELQNTVVVNLRLASIYGPGQITPGLIPNLTKKALAGESLELNARETKRDYLFIDDFLGMIETLLKKPLSASESINLGSGEGSSVETVATAIAEVVNEKYAKKCQVSFIEPLNEGLPADNTLSVKKAIGLGLIKKTTPLKEGIGRYVEWVKNDNSI